MRCRLLPLVLLSAGLFQTGSPAFLVVLAQDLAFDRVGNMELDANELAFDAESTLWAKTITDLWRLSPSGMWEEIGNAPGAHMLILSPDTLFRSSTAGTHRSTNGGGTFDFVYEEGGRLFSTQSDGPNDGVILVGALGATGISYSTDRGATFTEATVLASPFRESELHSAVEIPDGPAAGRLVAGAFNGILTSEDGGRTWAPSSLFQDFRYSTQRVVIGTHPGTGARRLYATVTDSQTTGPQLFTSDNDGLTCTNVPTMVDAYLFVFVPEDSGVLLAVEDGTALEGDKLSIHRSDDGGSSWAIVGELPAEVNGLGIHTNDMLLGPDDRLYVAAGRAGPERAWVYRTTEPVLVATEPGPEPPGEETGLRVYPNPATEKIAVERVALGEEIVLYDVLGRAVLRTRTPTDIDVSALPPGLYIVRAGGESRLVTVRR